MKPNSNSESPASSTGAPARARQKTVPISRNSGSGYERPERARTSHACEPCRERKTKCDGERPSCRRCLHTGTGCHYGYGKGWKKRKTAEDLTVTSKRLARYETLLSEILPMVSPEVRAMIDDVRQQQEQAMLPMADLTDSGTPISNHGIDSDYLATSPSIHRMPLPMPGTTSQPPIFAQPPRSLPPALVTEHSSPSMLGRSAKRKSPTEDSGNGSSIRLPSITRHGVLLEDHLRNAPPLSQQTSAPEPLVSPSQRSPNSMTPVLVETSSSQGGWSSGSGTQNANADTRRIIQESLSWLSGTVDPGFQSNINSHHNSATSPSCLPSLTSL